MTADLDFDEMFHLSDDDDEIAYVGASYLVMDCVCDHPGNSLSEPACKSPSLLIR